MTKKQIKSTKVKVKASKELTEELEALGLEELTNEEITKGEARADETTTKND